MPPTAKQVQSEQETLTTSLAKVGHSSNALLKQEQAQNNAIALREGMRKGDVTLAGRALLRVDVLSIERINTEREQLEAEVERLRYKYADLKDLFSSPNRQAMELERVIEHANKLKDKLNELPVFSTIKAQMEASEVATIKEIVTLVRWADQQINTSKGLSDDQIVTAAEGIAVTYGYLLVEDVAAAFRQAILKPDGPTMRLDTQVLMAWIKKYDDARCRRIAEKQDAQHQKSKG